MHAISSFTLLVGRQEGHTACKQEAPLSLRDRAMRRVNRNVANCHATVQKLLIRQVLTKSMVLLLFFITPYTAAHKYKKAKIHLKNDLKYKKNMHTNIKAHSSAR